MSRFRWVATSGTSGTGSTLTAQQIADIGTLVATIDSAAITGNKPVIEITVKTAKGGAVLGLAATTLRLGVAKLVPAANGFPSRWQSYINRSGTPSIATPVLASAVQANTESGVAAGWQELGAGKYRYTSAVDLEHGHDADRGRLRAQPDAPHQRRDRHVGQRPRARAGQSVQGLRAERRRRHSSKLIAATANCADLPRALRRARRSTPQHRILRGLPQPGARSTRTPASRSTSPTWRIRSIAARTAARRSSCTASTARGSTPAKSPIRSRSRSARPATSSPRRCRRATTGRRIRVRPRAVVAMTPA